MRDMETIETALHAAETGHLVFSTLHTLDATETINRIISVFPPHQQKQIRLQLASVLKAAIAQRLMPSADGSEPRARRRGPHRHRVHQGLHRRQGQDAPDPGRDRRRARRSTACRRSTSRSSACYSQGLVTLEEALRWAINVDEFKLRVQGVSTTADMSRDQMASSVFGKSAGARRRRKPAPAKPEITRFGK